MRSHRSLSLRWHSSVALFLLAAGLAVAAPTVNGRIEHVDSLRVVRVWGTPEEMGFAHGYLLADDIVDTINEIKGAFPRKLRKRRDRAAAKFADFIDLPPRMASEIRGLFSGIEAAKGKPPLLRSVARRLRPSDLVLHNAADMLRGFGCSGFTVWGERAGEAGLITTRNFDYAPPGEKTLAAQFVLVREPKDLAKVATITWPGYIGVVTGINEHGVCVFLHDGTGGRSSQPTGKTTPLSLVMSDVLERANAATAHDLCEQSLTSLGNYPYSYMVRLIAPRTADRDTPPARVFRVDPQGLSENPVGQGQCITTNHYLEPNGKPVRGVDRGSLKRYSRLSKAASSTVTSQAAWSALGEVASSSQRFPTMHSLVVFPELRRLELALATWTTNGVTPATTQTKIDVPFDALFVDER